MLLAGSFFIFSVFLLIMYIVANFIAPDPNLQNNGFFIYLTVFVMLFAVAVFVSVSFLETITPISMAPMFLMFIGVILFCVATVYFGSLIQLLKTEYIYFMLAFFILIVGWSGIFYIFKSTLSPSFYASFTGQLIAYLPCLLHDLFEFVLQDWLTTPRFIILMFILEAIFVALYFYLPNFVVYLYGLNHTTLLSNAVFLDETRQLPPVPSKQSNYAFSFWVNVSPTSSSKEFTIFHSQNGPRLNYLNQDASSSDSPKPFIVYFTNKNPDSNKYLFSLPNQTWNNVVFNYKNTICDLFVNGKLIHSHLLTDVSSIFPNGAIWVGEESGLYGSVANVTYFSKPLTLSYIQTNYALLRYKNPPVVTFG
jgi:hypothetical protein